MAGGPSDGEKIVNQGLEAIRLMWREGEGFGGGVQMPPQDHFFGATEGAWSRCGVAEPNEIVDVDIQVSQRGRENSRGRRMQCVRGKVVEAGDYVVLGGDFQWMGGSWEVSRMLSLAMSAAVSVKAEKYGGESVQPIGKDRGMPMRG